VIVGASVDIEYKRWLHMSFIKRLQKLEEKAGVPGSLSEVEYMEANERCRQRTTLKMVDTVERLGLPLPTRCDELVSKAREALHGDTHPEAEKDAELCRLYAEY